MPGLQDHLVAGQRQLCVQQPPRLGFEERKLLEELRHVGFIERVFRLLDLVLKEHVAVRHRFGVAQVVHRSYVLQVHAHPLEAVGDFAGDRIAIEPADLLEVGELGDFHAVHPDFPAQAPRAQGRVLPIVLDEAHVVRLEVEADGLERAQVEVEDVRRRGLEDDLELVVVLQAIGVLAIAPVLGTARGLHVGRAPRLRPERAQEGRGVRGARAHFHVVGLQDRATLAGPVVLEGQDEALERAHRGNRGMPKTRL